MRSHLSNQRLYVPPTIPLERKGENLILNKAIRIQISLPLNISFVSNFLALESRCIMKPKEKALWGTILSQLRTTIWGIHKGHFLKLKLVGVGYKANLKGRILVLRLGYNHRNFCILPKEVTMEKIKKRPPTFCLRSKDYEILHAAAHTIRDVRKPEPYKGKGVVFLKEVVRRKEGKKAKS